MLTHVHLLGCDSQHGGVRSWGGGGLTLSVEKLFYPSFQNPSNPNM